jgi:TolB-like protein
VVWSQTYDRPWDDILKIQDEIASEVTKALRASI